MDYQELERRVQALQAELALEKERNRILMTQIYYARQAAQLAVKILGENPNDVVPSQKVQDLADPSNW